MMPKRFRGLWLTWAVMSSLWLVGLLIKWNLPPPLWENPATLQVIRSVQSGERQPNYRGRTTLPRHLSHLSVEGNVFVTNKPGGLTLIYFVDGMFINHRGFVYSSRPLTPDDFAPHSTSEGCENVPGLEINTPTGPEAIYVEREINPHWHEVSWHMN
jgi:hypothetical protein